MKQTLPSAFIIALWLAVFDRSFGTAMAGEIGTKQLLPGIGLNEDRMRVDGTKYPWSSLVKIHALVGDNSRISCSGVLVQPKVVLTAAHCLFNKRIQKMQPPSSLHILLGYERGSYRSHLRVESYQFGSGFDGRQKGKLSGADWALLTLTNEAEGSFQPLPVAKDLPAIGTPVASAGFSQDKAHVILADQTCHVKSMTNLLGVTMVKHDCSGTFGTSGGPLLTNRTGQWEVVGVNVAVEKDVNLGLAHVGNIAVSASAFAAELERAQ
jgi:protease YdgD